MPSSQPDGTIHSENMCSQAVVERILGDESVTSIKIFNTLQSDNFSTGVSGWQIRRDTGSAEFQDITARGAITATSGELQTLSVTGTLTLSGSALIKSSNYVAATSGWQIEADGDAEFNDVTIRGTVVATSGSLSGLTIAGDLTMNSGGRILTDSGTSRVEIVYAALAGESDGIPSILWRMNNTVGGKIQIEDATPDNFRIESDNSANMQLTSDGDMFLFTTGGDLYLGGAGTAYYNYIHVDQGANDRIQMFTGSGSATETLRLHHNGGNQQALTVAGSASDPAWSFIVNTNTGMYRDSANVIGWATAGVERMILGNTRLQMGTAATGAAALYAAGAGTVSNPAFQFSGDTTTGFYRVSASLIGVTLAGAARYRFVGSNFSPHSDNSQDLGASTARDWRDAYITNGVTTGSDPATKRFTESSALSLEFVKLLSPAAWRWKTAIDDDGTTRPGRRIHHGLDAGNVKAALDRLGIDSQEFAGWIVGEDGNQRLRYHEFTGPIVAALQEVAGRLDHVEELLNVG